MLARIRATALDWRDSARPSAFSGLTIDDVSYESIGPDGFRLAVAIPGSRFFGASATGSVTAFEGGTIVRYTTAMDPSLGRASVTVAAVLSVVALVLGAFGGSPRDLWWLPLAGTPLAIIPSFAVASEAVDGHCRALGTLIVKATKVPRATL